MQFFSITGCFKKHLEMPGGHGLAEGEVRSIPPWNIRPVKHDLKTTMMWERPMPVLNEKTTKQSATLLTANQEEQMEAH